MSDIAESFGNRLLEQFLGDDGKSEEVRRWEASLRDFLTPAWAILEPSTPFVSNWHIDCICEYLEAVYAGQIRRLIINQPPRTLKSTLITKIFPCWVWTKNPSLRMMFCSYAATLSEEHSVDRRTLIQSAWYQAHWPEVKLSRDQNVKMQFSNTARGMMTATSIGGTSIGKGGDLLVFDDPISPQQSTSAAERTRANDWIRGSFLTRVNNEQTACFLGVMQRLNEQDTTGIFRYDPAWTILSLEAIAEARTIIIFPITGRQFVREEGDLLFPERLSADVLAQKKEDLGSYMFSGQFQQRPSPKEGGLFKRSWWRFWYPAGTLPPAVECTLEDGEIQRCPQIQLPDGLTDGTISVDCTLKDLKTSDYVVGQAWARLEADKFLLDQRRERLDTRHTCDMIRDLLSRYPSSHAILIEDKANGPAVIAEMQHEISGVIAVNPEGGKESRASAVAPGVESGNVYLPHPALFPWVNDLIEELAAFPNARYDDQCDCLSQVLLRYLTNERPPSHPTVSVPRHELVMAKTRFGMDTTRVRSV